MKKILCLVFVFCFVATVTAQAATVPRASVPSGATEAEILVAENLISGVLDEVQSGLGYADAWAKANKIIYNAVLTHQTNGYGYAILAGITRNAIWQYRDMYLRPDFYKENEETVKTLIEEVIESYASGEIDYNTAVKAGYEKLYQTVNPSFNLAEQLALDNCYRDIPAIDNGLFFIVRKLIMEAKE